MGEKAVQVPWTGMQTHPGRSREKTWSQKSEDSGSHLVELVTQGESLGNGIWLKIYLRFSS